MSATFMSNSRDRVPIEPQNIDAPLSQAAVFLVVTVRAGAEAMKHARGVVADISGLVRSVGFRDLQGRLSCNVGIGSNAWDRLGRPTRACPLRHLGGIGGAVRV